MRPSLQGCIAFASTLVLACTDASAPTAPTTTLGAVSTPTAALVNRFTSPFLQTLVDGDLVAVIGVSAAQLPAFCNGDDTVLDEIHIQEVSRPDGSLKLTLRGSPRVTIYPLGDAIDLVT
jgi:hypothetical protein